MSEENQTAELADEVEKKRRGRPPKEAAAPETFAEKRVVKNISGAPHVVFLRTVVPGGTYEMQAHDLKDENGNKRIKRAIEMGKLAYL